LKIERGCEKDSPIPNKWQIGGVVSQRCPKKQTDSNIGVYFTAYNFYKNGFLPNPGGWLNQTAKFIEVISLIDREVSALTSKSMEDLKNRRPS